MTTYSLTLRADQLDAILAHLLRPDGCEHVAYLLCRVAHSRFDPWDRRPHTKYLTTDVLLVPDDQVIESTPNVVTWRTTSFVAALRRAAAEGKTVAVVHNHPAGMAGFSSQDDTNEPDLVQLAQNRNGPGAKVLSLVLTTDGLIGGRVWLVPKPEGHVALRMIRVVGETIRLHYLGRGQGVTSEAFHRQVLTFGNALNHDLAHLRVGVVGCGGTGSAVAMLLARLGVGQIALIDNDIVDRTNLNRLHGARQADADAMRPKVEVVARAITECGLGVRVTTKEAWVGDPEVRDTLKSCDIVFGCTDDNDGRLFLNRFAYYYLTPIIDVGLAVDVSQDELPEVGTLDGRVTVLMPGHTCLVCRDVISTTRARAEALKRADPEGYEHLKAEAYIAGEGNPSPAVVTFTTETACMAVNEMLHRLQGFRGPQGAAANRVRKFHLVEDRRPGHKPLSGCYVCDGETAWAKGDTEPFLDRTE